MSDFDHEDAKIWLLIIAAILLFFGCIGWRCWWASAQADVWRKQGIDISNTQVFFGVRPAGSPSK